MRSAALLSVLLAAALVPWPSVGADHAQSVAGGSVRLDHRGGGEWWVEARVTATGVTLRGVEARDDGGSWKPLTLRSWGNWAGSFHVEPGHRVQFRATFASGSTESRVESCWFTHPAGVEQCGGTTWPREGSYVVYEGGSGFGVTDFSYSYDFTLKLTYTAGRWEGVCDVHYEEWHEDGRTVDRTTRVERDIAPLRNAKGRAAGTSYESHGLSGECSPDNETIVSAGTGTMAVGTAGGVRTVTTDRGEEAADTTEYQDLYAIADRANGLVLGWGHAHLHSGSGGRLVNTDAPLGPVLTTTQQKALQGTWPVEGSYVEYYWCDRDASGWDCDVSTFVHLEYRAGAWKGWCQRHELDGGEPTNRTVSFSPLKGPTSTSKGSTPYVDRLASCSKTTTQLVVKGTFPESVWHPDHGVYDVEAWWGDEPSWSSKDKDAWWDRETGLVLAWEYADQEGTLVATDLRLV